MSKLDDLLAALCPEGVEFRELTEIASYSDSRVDVSELDETNFVGVDNLQSDRAGRVDATHAPNTDRVTAYAAGDVLLGNIRPYLKKVWLADRQGGCSGDVLAVRMDRRWRDRLLPEFLFYQLSSDSFFAYNMRFAKGAKMPRGDKAAILRFRVPVPPLAIQSEIVQILGRFQSLQTTLQNELASEIRARSHQHIHYREQTLALANSASTERLGDIVDFFNAKAHEKLVDPAGTIALMTARFVSRGEANRFVRREDVLTPAYEGDVALVMSDLPNGKALAKTFYVDADDKYAANQRVCLLRSRDTSRLLPRFLHHVMHRNPQLVAYNNGMDQTHLKKDYILDVRIPVPTVVEQARIVGNLDKLDGYTKTLVLDLAAEVSERRKQSEYYHDRLLTFEELST